MDFESTMIFKLFKIYVWDNWKWFLILRIIAHFLCLDSGIMIMFFKNSEVNSEISTKNNIIFGICLNNACFEYSVCLE